MHSLVCGGRGPHGHGVDPTYPKGPKIPIGEGSNVGATSTHLCVRLFSSVGFETLHRPHTPESSPSSRLGLTQKYGCVSRAAGVSCSENAVKSAQAPTMDAQTRTGAAGARKRRMA